MFKLRTCPWCNAFRDDTEKNLCCLKGKKIVTPEMFPAWDRKFSEVVQRHAIVLFSHSREINNDLCFTSMGSDHAEQRSSGFVWRVDAKGPPTMYGLYGRVFHRYHDQPKQGGYYQVFRNSSSLEYEPAYDDIKTFLNANNVLAQAYHTLIDMQRSSECASLEHIAIRIHPCDEPSCPKEPFILLRQDYNNFSNNARVTCLIWSTENNPMFVDSASALYDPGQYPLLFPSGRGGYYDTGRSGKSSFINSQGVMQPCKGVLEFSKYVLYQKAHTLSFFPNSLFLTSTLGGSLSYCPKWQLTGQFARAWNSGSRNLRNVEVEVDHSCYRRRYQVPRCTNVIW